MNEVLVLVCGLCFGVGGVGLLAGWYPAEGPGRRSEEVPALAYLRPRLGRLALAGGAGVVAGLITGWPVAVVLAGVAVYGVPVLFGRTSGSMSIARIEAVATWTEMLQGTLAASAGLIEAVVATAPISPPVMRDDDRAAGRSVAIGRPPG